MKRLTLLAATIFMLSACAGNVKPSTSHMNQTNHPGAQDPSQPHPGTITWKYTWNGSTEVTPASKFPEFFVLYCYDDKGNRVDTNKAAYCVPVTEIVTISMDKQGKPAPPNKSEYIEISVYGPGHTFLKHITGGPRSGPVPPPPAPAK
ncbi:MULTISPECIES: hypothetical protein [unclassified Caballeronia]|uniref:hypothetical protein n=1 Tax=unclassified Caballeronia TaxID=2646786 RepID=UPI00286387B2|nr:MULTISPECIES: hypothetical protein [unclassified Caballeronia]MDR5825535.1 hypothetical protein [Caballeronia sp. LZ043]MDR5883413.1 hypothetical protein [Caballeronia sp. LZ032]